MALKPSQYKLQLKCLAPSPITTDGNHLDKRRVSPHKFLMKQLQQQKWDIHNYWAGEGEGRQWGEIFAQTDQAPYNLLCKQGRKAISPFPLQNSCCTHFLNTSKILYCNQLLHFLYPLVKLKYTYITIMMNTLHAI